MIRVLILVAVVALTVYCLVDLSQSPRGSIRLLPRWVWAVAIIGLPVLGPIAWLNTGKPRRGGRVVTISSPDDDENFLRGLRP